MIPVNEFMDQSHEDLRLSLISGSVDLRQFTLLKENHILEKWIQIESYIIGESHVIVYILNDNIRFYEILGCTGKVEKMDGQFVHESEIADILNNGLEYDVLGNAYKMQLWTETLSQPLNEEKIRLDQLAHFPDSGNITSVGMVHEFPKGELDFHPKTIVAVTLADDKVECRSAHTYPNEGVVVLSNSQLLFGESILKFRDEVNSFIAKNHS